MDKSERKIMKISRELERFLNIELKDEELGLTDLNIIHELKKNQGSTQKVLASLLNVDKSLISRRIKHLVEKGYIIVKTANDDKRKKILYTSDKGNGATKTRVYYESLYFEYLLNNLDEKETIVFLKTLDKLYQVSKRTRQNHFKEVLNYESK